MKKFILLLVVISYYTTNSLFSQEQSINTNNVALFAEEVYKSASQYKGEEYLQTYVTKLNRISIIQLSNDDYQNLKIKSLSEVPLIDKYNPLLVYDTGANFEMNKFNPLKYRFNYNLDDDQYFKVEGTQYVIKIKKQ